MAYIFIRSAGEAPVVLDANRVATDINLQSGGLFSVDIFSQHKVEAIAEQTDSYLE